MIEINDKTRSRISKALIAKTARKFFAYYGTGDKDLSIALVGDKTMRRLNRTCLGADRTTDVLAFPDEDENCLGEIVLCWPQIERQAKEYAGSAAKELVFVLVHGLLHLLGYRDDTVRQKNEMDGLTEDFVTTIKIKP
jgi:probable rRNA maturation factor